MHINRVYRGHLAFIMCTHTNIHMYATLPTSQLASININILIKQVITLCEYIYIYIRANCKYQMNHDESCSYSCKNSSFQNSQRPFRLGKSADGLFRSAKPKDQTTNGDERSLRRFGDRWTATTGHTSPGWRTAGVQHGRPKTIY